MVKHDGKENPNGQSMVFTPDNLVYALIGNAKNAGKLGLRFASIKTSDYNTVTFSNGKGGVRRQGNSAKSLQDAGNGDNHWL